MRLWKAAEQLWNSEKYLLIANSFLLIYTLICYFLYAKLYKNDNNFSSDFDGLFDENNPRAVHGFDTNEAYALVPVPDPVKCPVKCQMSCKVSKVMAFYRVWDCPLDAFDFTEQRKRGLGQPADLNPGPISPASRWCVWPIHTVPTKPDSRRILRIPSQIPWQATLKPRLNLEWYLFAAYYDQRPSHLCPDCQAQIHVLMMAKRSVNHDVYCQIYTSASNKPKLIVDGVRRMIWQREWDPRDRFYVPFLISCPLPAGTLAVDDYQIEVALTNEKCEQATNLLSVMHAEVLREEPLRSDKPVVCVKGVDYLDDNSGRLLEWIEANLLMGADKIVMYTYAVHENTRKVLEKYKADGSLVEVPLTLPGHQPNTPYQRSQFIWRNRQQKRRNEIIPYNDCLYRHLYSHRYALIVDTDELVVPLSHENWDEMLRVARGHTDAWTAFSIINAFKFDNISQPDEQSNELAAELPKTLSHMLRHNRRSATLNQPGEYGKSFMYIPNLVTVFNHFPLHKIRPNLRKTAHVKAEVALKLHFKEKCPIESGKECQDFMTNTVPDHCLDRFAHDLKERVRDGAKSVGFL